MVLLVIFTILIMLHLQRDCMLSSRLLIMMHNDLTLIKTVLAFLSSVTSFGPKQSIIVFTANKRTF